MEEQNTNISRQRRKSKSSSNAESSSNNSIDLSGSKFVQRDLELMDATQHEMQKLPYCLYHTLYEFAPVCRMLTYVWRSAWQKREEVRDAGRMARR